MICGYISIILSLVSFFGNSWATWVAVGVTVLSIVEFIFECTSTDLLGVEGVNVACIIGVAGSVIMSIISVIVFFN